MSCAVQCVAGLPAHPVGSITGGGTRTDMEAAHILVVDDHAESAEALVRLLRHAGHHVTAALTLADAVAAAASMTTVNAVISDITLPDGDGCDLLRLLRERRAGAPLLAIAVTGHD